MIYFLLNLCIYTFTMHTNDSITLQGNISKSFLIFLFCYKWMMVNVWHLVFSILSHFYILFICVRHSKELLRNFLLLYVCGSSSMKGFYLLMNYLYDPHWNQMSQMKQFWYNRYKIRNIKLIFLAVLTTQIMIYRCQMIIKYISFSTNASNLVLLKYIVWQCSDRNVLFVASKGKFYATLTSFWY